MYVALLLALLATSVWLARRGYVRLGWSLAVVTAGFFAFLSFWGEYLWFASLGYAARFWTAVAARVAVCAAGALAGASIVYVLTRVAPRDGNVRRWTTALGALIGAIWGLAEWHVVLQFVNRVPANLADPLYGKDVSFYLFTLPLYLSIRTLLVALALVAVIATGLSLVGRSRLVRERFLENSSWQVPPSWPPRVKDLLEPEPTSDIEQPSAGRSLYLPAAFLLVVLAWGAYLGRYTLMYSTLGAVTGPGWTDIHILIPAYWILAAVCGVCGVLMLIPAARDTLHRYISRRWRDSLNLRWRDTATSHAAAALAPFGIVALLAVVGLWVAPGLSQWLKVQPTELDLERPYLTHEIAFTRLAFGLDRVEHRQFPASEAVSPELIADNQQLLSEVRLWDHRVLRDVYKQFQAIRLYYQFHHVDVDRYRIDDRMRLVMISAREMMQSNLPSDNQTFVNTRFKFTHGNGVTLAPVSEFTNEGLPRLLVRGIPPVADAASLQIERPEIYYGMLTTSPVFVNSREPEFSYPSGSENVYSHYDGSGGIALQNWWRKLVFGWKIDGTRLLLSQYPTSDTRVQYRRQIVERVRALAPFLTVASDPYIVVSNGRLYWLLEGYTTSSQFPYSQAYQGRERIEYSVGEDTRTLEGGPVREFAGANYVRNAVKVVVDAYTGHTDLYVFAPDDPLIRVWSRVFPDLFKSDAEMPPDLRAHVRYPHELLLLQGLVNARYHMQDPVVFYNQEDLWTRATERYYEQVQPVEPYYIMWTPPDATEPEFVAMLPFTPKGRQVLIGWMAGLSDGENYGRLITYQFPKDERILGPQQVDTKIDQDPTLKAQLTLWDQRGSRVIRGNVLAIPINDTLLYVEPIFIEAETAAYPELRVVVVMHGDTLSYADTFDRALAGIVSTQSPGEGLATTGQFSGTMSSTAARIANEAFTQYLQLQGEGRFAEAAAQLLRLQQALRDMQPVLDEQ